MSFIELAKERYSVRKFSNQKVEDDAIQKILEAGQIAPTACNNQPQHFYVIKSDDALSKLKDCTPYSFDAPLAILVCYSTDESWKRPYDGEDSGATDASIATTHMMLALVELGLGSTWVGYFDPVAMRSAFSIPENLIPHALLPIGYPAADAKPAHLHEKRKSLENTAVYL